MSYLKLIPEGCELVPGTTRKESVDKTESEDHVPSENPP